jgi:hypothetical protein
LFNHIAGGGHNIGRDPKPDNPNLRFPAANRRLSVFSFEILTAAADHSIETIDRSGKKARAVAVFFISVSRYTLCRLLNL